MAALAPVPDEIAGLAGPPGGGPPSITVGGPAPPGGPGGPPDLGGGGGLPPELMAALGGGGAPGGPESEGPAEDAAEGGQEERGEIEILGEIRTSLMEYMDVADDDIEKDKAAQALKIIQSLLASNQSQQEAAGGITPALKGMRKAIGAGG